MSSMQRDSIVVVVVVVVVAAVVVVVLVAVAVAEAVAFRIFVPLDDSVRKYRRKLCYCRLIFRQSIDCFSPVHFRYTRTTERRLLLR